MIDFPAPGLAGVYLLAAYLLGAIPFGLLFSRWLRGRDPREYGSGNIGATNAMRTGGKLVGLLTLAADVAKGALPVALAAQMDGASSAWLAAVALSALLGHVFPVYLGFRGGKGVATMFGVLLPWMPWNALAAFALWLLVFFGTRYVAVASISAAWLLPVLLFWQHDGFSLEMGLTVAIASLVLLRHGSNIQRLLRGEEPKTGGKDGESYVEP